jgi:hypothetical protein
MTLIYTPGALDLFRVVWRIGKSFGRIWVRERTVEEVKSARCKELGILIPKK